VGESQCHFSSAAQPVKISPKAPPLMRGRLHILIIFAAVERFIRAYMYMYCHEGHAQVRYHTDLRPLCSSLTAHNEHSLLEDLIAPLVPRGRFDPCLDTFGWALLGFEGLNCRQPFDRCLAAATRTHAVIRYHSQAQLDTMLVGFPPWQNLRVAPEV
jgi:hypothetical protein